MPISAERRVLRARIAAYKRHHPDRPEVIEDEQTRFRALGLIADVRRLVDQDPPLALNGQQRAQLAALLGLQTAAQAEQVGGESP